MAWSVGARGRSGGCPIHAETNVRKAKGLNGLRGRNSSPGDTFSSAGRPRGQFGARRRVGDADARHWNHQAYSAKGRHHKAAPSVRNCPPCCTLLLRKCRRPATWSNGSVRRDHPNRVERNGLAAAMAGEKTIWSDGSGAVISAEDIGIRWLCGEFSDLSRPIRPYPFGWLVG